jgi:hypothetical protein
LGKGGEGVPEEHGEKKKKKKKKKKKDFM